MSEPSAVESYELVRFAPLFKSRLDAAAEQLAAKRGAKREREWITAAAELLETELAPAQAVVERARMLPELLVFAEDDAGDRQEAWVDALEKLLAGITFHAGSRAPLIESLFPHVKLPGLRRARKEAALDFAKDLERRIKSGYVTRMLAQEDFAFAAPVLELLAAAKAAWLAALDPKPMPEAEAEPIRAELRALGGKLEQATHRARLLAEAALVPFKGMFEEAGLNAKPRRRASKPVALPEPEPAIEVAPEPAAAAAPETVVPARTKKRRESRVG